MEYAKYRTRPIELADVEAVQFVVDETNLPSHSYDAIIALTNGQARVEELEDGTEVLTLHHSGDWWVDVDPGDYILRQGDRFFHVRKAVFEKVYEPLDPPAAVKKKRVRRTNAQIAADNAAKEAAK